MLTGTADHSKFGKGGGQRIDLKFSGFLQTDGIRLVIAQDVENEFLPQIPMIGSVFGDAETDVEAHRMNFDFFSLSRKACDFLEEQVKADKPFYLQLSHYAVHKQLQSLAETQAKYEMKKRGKWHYRAEFAACAEDLDTGIGIVLDKLAGSRIDGRRRFFLSDARHEIQRAVKVERSNS